MTSSTVNETLIPVDVKVDDTMIRVRFKNGVEIATPVDCSPRLRDATPEKRKRWQLNGKGYGIHLTVHGLLARARANLANVA